MPRNTAVAPKLARKIHHQPIKCRHAHVAQRRRRLAQHLHALFHGNRGFLTGFLRMPTVRCSKSFDPRWIRSMCPLVGGSNVPG